jgi:hypothetical protein
MADTHLKVPAAQHGASNASAKSPRRAEGGPPLSELVLSENIFHAQLTKERKRADRSRKPFILMLLDAHLQNGPADEVLQQALTVLAGTKRETDLVGWYKEGAIAGVIFTEVNVNGEHAVMKMLRDRTQSALDRRLGPVITGSIHISMHVFPESWDPEESGWATDRRSQLG